MSMPVPYDELDMFEDRWLDASYEDKTDAWETNENDEPLDGYYYDADNDDDGEY